MRNTNYAVIYRDEANRGGFFEDAIYSEREAAETRRDVEWDRLGSDYQRNIHIVEING